MVAFTYNNAKNTSTSYTSFKLNCGFYSKIFYKKDLDSYLKLKTVNQLATEL